MSTHKHKHRRHHHTRGVVLPASLKKNDKVAYFLIFTVSIIVFAAVVILGRVEVDVNLGFDKHIFARLNALINSFVALLLLGGLWAAKDKRFNTHKKLMLWAIGLSVLFLVSYIAHHLFTGETSYGGSGLIKLVYYFILFTHIPLAGLILPFILFSAYRGLTAEYDKHRKLVRYTWPLWLYVAITGVVVYFMISPYYGE
jgi:putative membrane protein